MTKANMIDTLINDTLAKRKEMNIMEEKFGMDSRATIRSQSEWVAMYSTLRKLNLVDKYISKLCSSDML